MKAMYLQPMFTYFGLVGLNLNSWSLFYIKFYIWLYEDVFLLYKLIANPRDVWEEIIIL